MIRNALVINPISAICDREGYNPSEIPGGTMLQIEIVYCAV
jgi:hypothetical protein